MRLFHNFSEELRIIWTRNAEPTMTHCHSRAETMVNYIMRHLSKLVPCHDIWLPGVQVKAIATLLGHSCFSVFRFQARSFSLQRVLQWAQSFISHQLVNIWTFPKILAMHYSLEQHFRNFFFSNPVFMQSPVIHLCYKKKKKAQQYDNSAYEYANHAPKKPLWELGERPGNQIVLMNVHSLLSRSN